MNSAVDLALCVRWFECLLAWNLVLQTTEYLRIHQQGDAARIWIWSVQRADIPASAPWVRSVLDVVYRQSVHQAHLYVRLGAAVCLAVMGAHWALMAGLFVSTVLLLIRWRGAFNGGSDFMTLVLISGALIAQVGAALGHESLGWQAGLAYVTIHAVGSYFMSGWVKLKNKAWRSGQALTVFLNGAVYGPLPQVSVFRRPWLARLASWAFIIWECSFPLALGGPLQAALMCGVAAFFHFLVFWFFGLNRFFWAWMGSFPAIYYCSGWRWLL